MDLEATTLGLLTDNVAFRKAWGLGIKSELFETPLNRQAFTFARDYWFNTGMEKAPTKDALQTEFPALNIDDDVDESIDWLVSKLKDRFIINQLQTGITDVVTLLDSDIPAALRAMNEVSWSAMQTISPRVGRSDLSQNITERRERYLARHEITDLVRGAPLGFPRVDEHTQGILPGEIALIAGFAKTGKTHALIHAFIEARRGGYTPILFSLELSMADIEDRMDAHMSGVSYERYQRGQLRHDEMAILLTAQEEFADIGSSFVEKPPTGERTVQHLLGRARELGCDYVLIDQLSFVEPRRQFREMKDQITEIVKEMKTNASENENTMLSILMAVQFNREVKKRTGAPGMENLALSSALEQTVDFIYGLRQSKEMRTNKSMVLDMLGARRVDLLSWLLRWEFGDRTVIEVRDAYED